MTMQQRTLDRYRKFYPNDTLRQTSQRTGIQMTRIFRLYNGMNMKVQELEKFENAINQKLKENPSFSQFQKTFELASAVLTNEEISSLTHIISRKIKNKSYSRSYYKSSYEDAIIA